MRDVKRSHNKPSPSASATFVAKFRSVIPSAARSVRAGQPTALSAHQIVHRVEHGKSTALIDGDHSLPPVPR